MYVMSQIVIESVSYTLFDAVADPEGPVPPPLLIIL